MCETCAPHSEEAAKWYPRGSGSCSHGRGCVHWKSKPGVSLAPESPALVPFRPPAGPLSPPRPPLLPPPLGEFPDPPADDEAPLSTAPTVLVPAPPLGEATAESGAGADTGERTATWPISPR